MGSNDEPLLPVFLDKIFKFSEREVRTDVEVPSGLEIDVSAVGGKEIRVSHIGEVVDAAEELQATAPQFEHLGIERQINAVIAFCRLLALCYHAFLLGSGSHH